MKKTAFIFLTALMLTGCTAQQLGVSTNDPDARLSAVRMRELGDNKYMISCVDSNQYCEDLAANVCGGKFKIRSAWGQAGTGFNDSRRTIVVKCTGG